MRSLDTRENQEDKEGLVKVDGDSLSSKQLAWGLVIPRDPSDLAKCLFCLFVQL